jgi:hypothetical protein
MIEEPRYVEEGEEFEEESRSPARKPRKLLGSTDLQRAALAATGRSIYGFRDNDQWKAFSKLEEFAKGADDESRMWNAWIKYRIDQTAHFNVKVVNVPLDQLIYRIGMQDKREEWFMDNRAKVLKKQTAQEVAGTIDPDMVGRMKE